MIEDLGNKGILIDYGPVTAIISIIKNGINLKKLEYESFEIIKNILLQLKDFKNVMKVKASRLNLNKKNIPEVVKKTVNASRLIEGDELTPLSAIAGGIGEVLIERLREKDDMDRIIFNNGGDTSLYCRKKDYLPVINCQGVKLKLVSKKVKGIATSGRKGRSFTKGIADFVTVFAVSPSVADAAATYIGNNVTTDSEKIRYEPAEVIDFNTDLKGEKVVVSIGNLTEAEVEKAIENGANTAENLIKKEKILCAVISLKNRIYFTSNIEKFIRKEN